MFPGKNASMSRAEQLQRDKIVSEMRLGGLTLQDIATRIGVSVPMVHKIMKRINKRALDAGNQNVNELRQMQLDRYNSLLSACWVKAKKGDEGAIKVAISALARIDRLYGLEASEKRELTGPDGKPIKHEMDLTRLNTEELEALAKLADKVADTSKNKG